MPEHSDVGQTEFDLRRVSMPGVPEVEVALAVPRGWDCRAAAEPETFIASMPVEVAGPFVDNVMVSIERLPEGAPRELDEVQGLAYAQAFASVPDFHAIDDRAVHLAHGGEAWFRAALQTAPNAVSAVTRQLLMLHEEVLVTVSLTTLALRDPEAARWFRTVADSAELMTTTRKGTSP